MKVNNCPIEPVGAKILNHPDFQKWFKQGYASQEPDGLWLHYTAICSVLRSQLAEAQQRLATYEDIRLREAKLAEEVIAGQRDLATAQARIVQLETDSD